MSKGKRKRAIPRKQKEVARMMGEIKIYNTTHGSVYLNPLKRSLKNEPYKNAEFSNIMREQVNMTIEMLRGENK